MRAESSSALLHSLRSCFKERRLPLGPPGGATGERGEGRSEVPLKTGRPDAPAPLICPPLFLNLRNCVSRLPGLGFCTRPRREQGSEAVPTTPSSGRPPSAHLAGAAPSGTSTVQQGFRQRHPQLRPLQVELHQQVPAAPAQHTARHGGWGCCGGGAAGGTGGGGNGQGVGALTCRPTAGGSSSGAQSPS